MNANGDLLSIFSLTNNGLRRAWSKLSYSRDEKQPKYLCDIIRREKNMEDNNNALQKELLKKLTEYGDSVLETRFSSRKKKKRKLKHDSQINVGDKEENVDKANLNNEPRKKKRKKKKKNRENDDTCSMNVVISKTDREESVTEIKTTVAGPKKHVDGIVGELGLKQFKSDLQRRETSVLNGDTKRQNAVKAEPEVIVFTSRKDRKEKMSQRPFTTQKAESTQNFDIKQARFEVRKFGLAGFQGSEKEKAMTDLLLSLGAKPKKKTYLNYKELLQKRKEEMISEADKREQDRQQGLKVGKKKNSKRPRDRNDVGAMDGQVGKFTRGVQYIKPNDVQGIKKSKLKTS